MSGSNCVGARHVQLNDSVVAIYESHLAADSAVKKLASSGFRMTSLSVVGKGYHTEGKVVGFYTTGDRITFCGSRGALWGGLWGIFFGGVLLMVPVVGHVIVLGYIATVVISTASNAFVAGGLSAIGAALVSIGIPKDSVIRYEAAIKQDRFLVMVHGTPDELSRAQVVLGAENPLSLDVHTRTPVREPNGLMQVGS
jgi:hypothetical protein